MKTPLARIERPDARSLPESAGEFLAQLGGATSIRVRGRDPSRVRVVTTLLHGNEPSGLRAILTWLRSGAEAAVDARLVLANVAAARAAPGLAHRMLPGRRDLNRCFHGPFDDLDGALARAILDEIHEVGPEAVIDVHNNTGHNPAYGVGVVASPETLRLVAPFGDRFVLSHLRLGALMEALRGIPSATVEVGRSGDPEADAVALRGLRHFLEAGDVLGPGAAPAIQVLEMPLRACLRAGTSLVVSDTPPAPEHPADLTIRADLDRHNFETLEAGALLGWVRGAGYPLELVDESGRDRAARYFEVSDGQLRARRPLIPIMITTDPAAAAADCLFYVVRPAER